MIQDRPDASGPQWRQWGAIGLMASIVALSGCGSTALSVGGASSDSSSGGAVPAGSTGSSGSFVGKASNAVVFITWTQSAGQLSGELEQGTLHTDSGSGQESVATESDSFTGTVSGSSVTLTLSQGLGATSNLTGRLSGSQLDLNYPGQGGGVITLQMQAGTANDYNQDLSGLQSYAGQANAQVQQAQAAQQRANSVAADAQTVANDLNNVQSTVSNVNGTGSVAGDLARMQKDVGQTQADMQHVLGEVGQVDSSTLCGDADTVSGDADTVQGDYDTIHGDQDSSGGDASNITATIQRLQHDQAALDVDRQSDPGDVPANAPSDAQIAQAIKAAQAKSNGESGTTSSALSQAQAMLNTANGYASKAQNACSADGG